MSDYEHKWTGNAIQHAVANYFGVSITNMRRNYQHSDERTRRARKLCMLAMRDVLGWSFPKIAKSFGLKDHVGIMKHVGDARADEAADRILARFRETAPAEALPDDKPLCCGTCGQPLNKASVAAELKKQLDEITAKLAALGE